MRLTTAPYVMVFLAFAGLIGCGGGSGDSSSSSSSPSWGDAAAVEQATWVAAPSPRVAMLGGSKAVTVWMEFDGAFQSIYANTFTESSGWGTPELIETGLETNADIPLVASDQAGNAVAVWSQDAGSGDFQIYSNTYTAGTWGVAERISEGVEAGVNPQVTMNGNGNAMAVWTQWDGSYMSVYCNTYSIVDGWGTAALAETDDTGDAYYPVVAINNNGDAIAVWRQSSSIWANIYTAGVGWGTAREIESGDGEAFVPRAAMDDEGNAVVVWQQNIDAQTHIYSNTYAAGTGWGTAELIENGVAGDAAAPQIAMDGAGNAVAVWWYLDDGVFYSIYADTYTKGTGWGDPVLLENETTGSAMSANIAMNQAGDAVAVWQQDDGAGNWDVWSSTYVSHAWGGAIKIEAEAGQADSPDVAIDGNGRAMAVWSFNNGVDPFGIWANFYSP